MGEGTRKLGKYEMQSRLAQGGMGEVWKAFDSQLKRVVAIKLLRTDLQYDPEFTLRFEREAQLIASLRHPNIVQIHDFDVTTEDDGQAVAYMVMDYVKGQTLADYIRSTSRKGTFPSAENIAYLFAIIGLAMDYAHEKGMVHRDIKPANILLDQRLPTTYEMGEPILTDFGIARLQGAATGTIAGSLLGTPLYISPEQARGQHGDKRSDLYSLGIILYEIVTGVTPFRGETTLAILMQQLNEVPTPPALINPNIPAALSAVILKSIAKQPDDRYNSASEMTLELASALNALLPERFIHTQRARSRSRSLSGTTGPIAPAQTGPTPQLPVRPQPAIETRPIQPPAIAQLPTQKISPNTPAYPTIQPFSPPQSFAQPKPVAPSLPARSQTTPFLSKRKLTAFILITLLGLVLSTGVTMLLLRQNKPAPSIQQIQKAGTLRILQMSNVTDTSGQLHIQIAPLKPAQPGHTYYAWIESNSIDISPPHWSLAVQNNAVDTTVTVPQMKNLLSNKPVFLVTDETILDPMVPYTNPNARLYYAPMSTSTTQFTIQSCSQANADAVCMGS